nr:venom protein [Lampona murina]
MFVIVAVVFSAELQVEEKDVELARSEEEFTTYTYSGCTKYWEMCMFLWIVPLSKVKLGCYLQKRVYQN